MLHTGDATRIRCDGKFFRWGDEKWFAKGFCYGPFKPDGDGDYLPPDSRLATDLARMVDLGANVVRLYHPPSQRMLDLAGEQGLRVFIDIPWDKHRCFLEDWDAMQTARDRVARVARDAGRHPAVFAISVANELPADVVRYQDKDSVGAFIDELMGIVKHEAPECLTTFVNFPSTEFLTPTGCDFQSFNVFLHEEAALQRYLDRLQHRAGEKPVVISEYGIDTLREGEQRQAELLGMQLRRVYQQGCAGSFVFSFTDEWFTGGQDVDDWAFGVCRRDRSDKRAAEVVRDAWQGELPKFRDEWPPLSVVVCSYNGGKTLRECLQSLMELDYPDYEVILIDDGSTDGSAEIAANFPQVIYHHQENQGLSVARNVGAKLASGEIVAYTDSDCIADPLWLRYLVDGMLTQKVEGIGGLNLPPTSDGWIAKCVNASPGNPAHVMLDDRHAEHVPGCNMAFKRQVLLGLGGFDSQFRQAGDDVDLCWRMLDANLQIGFAPAAMVWHHRRATIKAYAKQQKGYGRSEALVHFKHPQRCGVFGRSIWRGVIYGDAMLGRLSNEDIVYHGRFGAAPYQLIYRNNHYSYWNIALSLEWHAAAFFLLALSLILPLLMALPISMWMITLGVVAHAGWTARTPAGAPWLSRLIIGYLHLLQPVVRGWYRLTHLLHSKRLRRHRLDPQLKLPAGKRVSASRYDLYWETDDCQGREELLTEVVHMARAAAWPGDFDNGWADWDIKMVGDPWHDIELRTATEEIGWPRRFTRAKVSVSQTKFAKVVMCGMLCWSVASLIGGQAWALTLSAAGCAALLMTMAASRRHCVLGGKQLVARAIERLNTPSQAGTFEHPPLVSRNDHARQDISVASTSN